MAYLTGYQYYENDGQTPEDKNWGSYQYVSLKDIVNNFMLMYQGNHELINNVDRNKVAFFAKRAIQELNYDALKETKVLQLDVCDNLRFVLPPDYVNWVRISMFKDGLLLPLTENIQTNWAKSYLQDNNCRILFDHKGDILSPSDYSSLVDRYRIDKLTPSIYLNEGSPYYNQQGYCCDGNWYFEYPIGARYGLNTETANQNATFKIDKVGGVINFSSDVAGESIVLEYVSDGIPGNHSPFMKQLLKGLRDYGGKDGILTVEELMENYMNYINPQPYLMEFQYGNEPGSSFIFIPQ